MIDGQINLYRLELLPRPPELPVASILKILVCVCATLVLIGLAQQWQIRYFHTALAAATQEGIEANKQLEDYGLRYPPLRIDPALQAQVEATEKELRGKNRMLRLVEGGKRQKSPGFSRFLTGFSRQHVPGLWLENILVKTHGDLFLTGSVQDASMLPFYLERLAGDSAFSEYEFQTFRVVQPGQQLLHDGHNNNQASPPQRLPATNNTTGALHFELRANSKSALDRAGGNP